jgi:hypothetical protein
MRISNLFTDLINNIPQIINKIISDRLLVLGGVLQWSVLGPLLFVTFINDLVNRIRNICKLYADYTKLFQGYEEDNAVLQHDFNRQIKCGKM